MTDRTRQIFLRDIPEALLLLGSEFPADHGKAAGKIREAIRALGITSLADASNIDPNGVPPARYRVIEALFQWGMIDLQIDLTITSGRTGKVLDADERTVNAINRLQMALLHIQPPSAESTGEAK